MSIIKSKTVVDEEVKTVNSRQARMPYGEDNSFGFSAGKSELNNASSKSNQLDSSLKKKEKKGGYDKLVINPENMAKRVF